MNHNFSLKRNMNINEKGKWALKNMMDEQFTCRIYTQNAKLDFPRASHPFMKIYHAQNPHDPLPVEN